MFSGILFGSPSLCETHENLEYSVNTKINLI